MRIGSAVRSLLLLVLLAFGWAPATAQGQGSRASDAQELTLRPGDVLRIEIWREGELSGEFVVDVNGSVTLPLLGEQHLADVPLARLREHLAEQYRTHLRNPSINVTPLRRVHVLGEVQRPGIYAVDPTYSLAGVVSLAGGAGPNGDLQKIRVVRDGRVLLARADYSETLAAVDVRSGDQILVEQKGWFARNSTFLVSALLSVTSIVTTIILNSK